MEARGPVADERSAKGAETAAILLDARGLPICVTSEALRVLTYPHEAPVGEKARREAARQACRLLLPARLLSSRTPQAGKVILGRRCYLYRIERLRDPQSLDRGPAALILFERYRPPWLPDPAALAPYHLTDREGQALRLVLQGLSNKQIAEAMGISTNTVKTFVRLIMTKMGVDSRFGIVGKLQAGGEPAAGSPAPPATPAGARLPAAARSPVAPRYPSPPNGPQEKKPALRLPSERPSLPDRQTSRLSPPHPRGSTTVG